MIEYIEKGHELLTKGLEIIRDITGKIVGFLPWDEGLGTALVLALISLYLGYLFVSKFTTHPLSTSYIAYLLILASLIFIILMWV